ncbi:MAG TPA: DUF2075 domain-containing protein [Deltaproteobacteria bacterium]|nr:DUF2075 domain-containing protein [Deltaproteobacteria bacterium]
MDLLEFYGLKEDPFRLTPDPMFFFPSAGHKEALMSMEYLLTQKEGFCLITGEPGTGKTTLMNVFVENWRDRADIALIVTPRLEAAEFLRAVLDDLGVPRREGAGKADLLRDFRDFLVSRRESGRAVAVIVDEAQDLPDDTLEELRLLTNLETDKEKLLQVILIGQPELEERLASHRLRHLNQRISVAARLAPLSRSEISEYINYRLIKAGKGFLLLDDSAARGVYSYSRGVPRLANLLTSRSIMSAYLEGSNVVSPRHVRLAASHLKGRESGAASAAPSPASRRGYAAAAVLAVALAAGVGAALYVYGGPDEPLPPVASAPEAEATAATAAAEEAPPAGEAPKSPAHSPAASPTLAPAGATGTAPVASVTPSTPAAPADGPATLYGIVNVSSANIRSEPSIDGERVGVAFRSQRLPLTGETRGERGIRWYRVRLYGDTEGWISGNVLTLVQEQKSP